jgi:hypothetical protein
LDSHRMRRAPHPPFSPNLAPSDFCLFDKLKTALMGSAFKNEQELLDGIMRVLDTVTRENRVICQETRR